MNYNQEAWEQAAKALASLSESQEYLVTPSDTPIETVEKEVLMEIAPIPLVHNFNNNLSRKTFKCPSKDCSKIYKNSNGLKYHLEKGTCVISRGISPDSSPGSKNQHLEKPYYCKLGCVKYYRNINGLKYHARIEHSELDFERDVKGVVSVDI